MPWLESEPATSEPTPPPFVGLIRTLWIVMTTRDAPREGGLKFAARSGHDEIATRRMTIQDEGAW
jgi:hypothetical protein